MCLASVFTRLNPLLRIIIIAVFVIGSVADSRAFRITTDPTFGTDGQAVFHFILSQFGGFERTFGADVFIQPGGRIVAVCKHESPGIVSNAKSIGVYGLLENGVIDPTYGTAGKTVFYVEGGGYNNNYFGAKMLPDGQLLILREVRPIKGTSHLVLTRLSVNGIEDTSFDPNLNLDTGVTTIYGFDTLADGRIMVLLRNDSPLSFCLLRLTEDGSRDPTFGIDGVQRIRIVTNTSPFHNFADFAVGSDGKAIIAYLDGTLARFDANGFTDRSFIMQGTTQPFPARPLFFVNKLRIQPDGKYLLIGSSGNVFSGTNPRDFTVARVTRRGKPDQTFGQNGIVIADVLPDGRGQAENTLILSDGTIVLVGSYAPAGTTAENIFIAKYTSGGELLSYAQTQFPTAGATSGAAVVRQPDGKYVVAGTAVFSSQLSKMDVFRFTDSAALNEQNQIMPDR